LYGQDDFGLNFFNGIVDATNTDDGLQLPPTNAQLMQSSDQKTHPSIVPNRTPKTKVSYVAQHQSSTRKRLISPRERKQTTCLGRGDHGCLGKVSADVLMTGV
jgi:hypothetical protein